MNKLRFLHIPKTAGTTFNSILKMQYFGSNAFYFNGSRNLDNDLMMYKKMTDHEKEKIGLFLGHAPFITGIDDADNAKTITFLRDPIARVKSFCQYVSVGKSQYLAKEFPPDKFNLDNFLDSGNGELTNLQTKMLINQGASSYPFNELTASEAVDMAMDNLFNKIFCYGIQEYFDESLIIFADALKWKMPFYDALNKKSTKKSLSFKNEHIEKITELNKIDIEVYRLAKERFISLINDKTFNSSKLKRFQSFNKPVSIAIKGMRKIYRSINK